MKGSPSLSNIFRRVDQKWGTLQKIECLNKKRSHFGVVSELCWAVTNLG